MTALRIIFAAALLGACSKHPADVIAEGDGIRITSQDLDAQLAELAPPVRQVMQTPERKRMLVDNLVRLELLARAAEKEGLANDPAVQFALKKAMAARYRDRFLAANRAAKTVTDAEVRQYYEQHRDDFSRPARVRVELVFLDAAEGSSTRAGKAAQARTLLDRVLAAERTNPDALAQAARENSDDPVTRPLGGDLGFKTSEELEIYGKQVADAAFALGAGRTWGSVIETPRGFYLVRAAERLEAQTRSLDEVQGQIAARLTTQRGEDEFEDLVKKLRDAAGVRISDDALTVAERKTP